MNKRFWIAVVACFVVAQVMGFLIHSLLLAETYKSLASVWRPEADMMSKMWIMALTSAASVFLFCYVFTKGYENKGVAEGLRYGLLMGLFLSVPQAFEAYVIYPVPFSLALTWFAAGIVAFLILGAVLASIYRREA